jgi:hypothetical protein
MSSSMNAQPALGIRLAPSDDLGLIVEVDGSRVLVRTPRSGFQVTYKKSPGFPELVLESEWLSGGMKNSVGLAKFRARAWRLANDAANELGWFQST